MLLGDARRLVGMGEQPAVEDLAIRPLGRAGPFLPRIGSGETAGAQILVIRRPVAACRMQSVVALIGLEAAFGKMHADRRGGLDAESGQALAVGCHMGLADQHVAHAERAQMVAQGRLADAQWKAVPARPVRAHVAAGVKAHARRPADRRLDISAGEAHAARRQRVEVRRPQKRVATAAEIVEAELVAHDEQNVARRRHFPSRLQSDPKQRSKLTDQSAFQLFSSSGRSKPLAPPPPRLPLLVFQPAFLADAPDIPIRS